MQPDSAREVVDAILATTPIDGDDGTVVTGWRNDPVISDFPIAVWGDPRPVAARQAVAALRTLADLAAAERTALYPGHLRRLADQLDTQETDRA